MKLLVKAIRKLICKALGIDPGHHSPDPVVFRVIHQRAEIPKRATDGSAGFDLVAIESVVIPPGGRAKLPTGLEMAIPDGHAGMIWPRSGMSSKNGVAKLAGLIDWDYRGQVFVVLINHDRSEPVEIRAGDRFAQLVVVPVVVEWAEALGPLPKTGRAEGGFGSTGTGRFSIIKKSA